MRSLFLFLLCILFFVGCETTTQTSIDVRVNPYDMEDMQIQLTLKGVSHV